MVVIAANTPHIAWDAFRRAAEELGVKAIPIHEPVAGEAARRGYRRVGLLATSSTVEAGFYQEALRAQGVEALTPPVEVQATVDKAIEALAFKGPEAGSLEELSRAARILGGMGAEAVIIACTDASPYTSQIAGGAGVPVLDASVEHVKAALRALGPR